MLQMPMIMDLPFPSMVPKLFISRACIWIGSISKLQLHYQQIIFYVSFNSVIHHEILCFGYDWEIFQ